MPLARQIAFGVQGQIATFLASDGTVVIHPEPARLFETPIAGPLPEELNYLPPAGALGAATPVVNSPAVAGALPAAPLSGASLADEGTSAAREDGAPLGALATAWAGQPLPRPVGDTSPPSEWPTPLSLDGARLALVLQQQGRVLASRARREQGDPMIGG